MIHDNALSVQQEWQKDLAQAVTRPEDLFELLDLSTENAQQDFEARKLFPMRVPRPFIQKMRPGDRLDPLLLQVLPVQSEFLDPAGYSHDPLEEQDAALPGMLHKYKTRILVIFKGGCAVNCRYCFRRHFPYDENHINRASLMPILTYIQAHSEINEVILSGGDPLMAKDNQIAWFLAELEKIEHVRRLRIHTRLPVVIPARLTTSLANLLQQSHLDVVMVLHVNHGNEIDDLLAQGVQRLKQAGVYVLNQAVLLKGINDSPVVQITLSEKLFSAGILPYYLHVLDKVKGAAHFDVTEEHAKKLMREVIKGLPGFLVPKLVREIGGEPSKTPIHY
ncbi:EF-P beta-lysylation protein EpmB [Algicola sagamiensis]|uniref:EF-P beta-lysylation protein EpmB n=1 Tax=Algicola sagamiensis TaxID=163869 RepID=UPI0003643209|nr:EF-P beta-lysylation protein EpmB [Algicola sagamiensis]